MADFTPVAAALKAYIDALVAEKMAEINPKPEPQPEPEPEPETPPAPAPTYTLPEKADTATVFQVVDYNDGFTVHGVNAESGFVVLRANDAVKKGLKLRFKNGQGSIVTNVTPFTTADGAALLITYVGAITLIPAQHGAPGSCELYGFPVPQPVPQPEPTPKPEPEFPGADGFQRREVGRVCANVGLGAGNDAKTPGIEGTSYTMAKAEEMDRVKAMGIDLMRVGFLDGRVFPSASDPTTIWQGNDVTQPTWGRVMTFDHLVRIGEQAADRGMEVMLDNHNYGYFPSNGHPSRQLLGTAGNTVEQWVERNYALLKRLMANQKAWSAIKRFDVINEPYMALHSATFLAAAYQKLLDRCAPLTGTGLIYVFEGPQYSSMSQWAELVGDAFDKLTHPLGKAYIEFSAHGYLDRGRDGYFDENKDGIINEADELLGAGETWETLHISRAKGFVDWLKAKGFNGSVGESIVPGNLPKFVAAFERLIRYLCDNGVDVYLFAVADGIDKKSEHNLETTYALSGGVLDNTATLALAIRMAGVYNRR